MNEIVNGWPPYRMKVICAWCGADIGWTRCVEPDQTSHGICQLCLDEQAAKLAALSEDSQAPFSP